MPFTIELCFRRGGTLNGVQTIDSDDNYQLVEGYGSYTAGDDRSSAERGRVANYDPDDRSIGGHIGDDHPGSRAHNDHCAAPGPSSDIEGRHRHNDPCADGDNRP